LIFFLFVFVTLCFFFLSQRKKKDQTERNKNKKKKIRMNDGREAGEVNRFFSEAQETKAEPRKSKRKKTDAAETKEAEMDLLRTEAKVYCVDSAEWKSINKYNKAKLTEWLEEKKFLDSKDLSESVFSGAVVVLSIVMDKLVRADGYVEREIQNDISLRRAIELELKELLFLLNNKLRIIALTSINVLHGKRRQLREAPPRADPTGPIIEEIPSDHFRGEEAIDRSTVSGFNE
jgi:hypothetical protein